MRDHVAAANVEDERDLRLKCGDVGEVLLRTYAEIGAAGFGSLHQIRKDRLIRGLVRRDDLKLEGTAGFGKLGDHPPVLRIAQLRREGLGSARGR